MAIIIKLTRTDMHKEYDIFINVDYIISFTSIGNGSGIEIAYPISMNEFPGNYNPIIEVKESVDEINNLIKNKPQLRECP